MKKIALAAAISLAASAAIAGNTAPVVEPIVEVVDAPTSSSSGALLPILALLLIGAAVAASN